MRFKKFSLLLLFLFISIPVSFAWAGPEINVAVKTVLASQESKFFDPRLSDLIEELQSVFRYTSYRLLSQDRLTIGMQKTGKVMLPGKRVLEMKRNNNKRLIFLNRIIFTI